MSDERKIVEDAVRDGVADEARFRKLVLSGDRHGPRGSLAKTNLEPVAAGGELKYKLVSRDDDGAESEKIVARDGVEALLAGLLESPFRHLHLITTGEEMHVRVSQKGRYLVSRGKGAQRKIVDVKNLEREKERLINPQNSAALLNALGMLSHGGVIKATMFAKYRQVNRFLELLNAPPLALAARGGKLNVLDCGCGKAYLTFALYHYLRNVLGIRASIEGVDSNARIIADCNNLRDKLRYDDLQFMAAAVKDYEPFDPPDIVLSLHACDLATDEAIAKGINLGASRIIAVPCCQHELHDVIMNDLMKPILRHGILRERTADILTDAFRALVLRICGYKAEAIEFIDPDATGKNIMIRAEKAGNAAAVGYLKEYRDLCEFWGVRPAITEMLAEPWRKIFEAR